VVIAISSLVAMAAAAVAIGLSSPSAILPPSAMLFG